MKKMGFHPEIKRTQLSREMAKIPSFVFMIGVVKAEAEAKKGRAEDRKKIIKAQVEKKIRKRALDDGDKLTEADLKARVNASKRVIKARKDLIEKTYDFNVCWAAATSAKTKSDQLTNISMNYRKELDAGIHSRVKESRAKDKASKFS